MGLGARLATLHPAWVGLAGALLYAPAVGFGFLAYDDPWLVAENPLLRAPSVATLRAIFFDLSSDHRFRLGAEYLPMRDLSVMLDHALFGDWAGGHHLTNVLLYGAATALVGVVVLRWFGSRALAASTALLFALHPVHVEAVAWVSERKGLLAATLFLASLAAAHDALVAPGSGRRRAARSAASIALFVLAVWSKAPTVAGAVILPALVAFAPGVAAARPLPRRAWGTVAGWSAAGLLAFTPAYVAGKSMGMVQPFHAGGWAGTAWLFGAIHAEYVALMTLLRAPNIAYPVLTAAAWQQALGWALVAAGLVPILRAIRGRPAVLGVAALWWFAFLGPVSHLVFPIQNLMADRYLLLPSVGACLAAAHALGRLSPGARGAVLGVVAAALVILSLTRLSDWRSTRALFARAVELDPTNAEAWNQLAEAEARAGDPGAAERTVERGIAAAGPDWRLVHRAALLHLARGDTKGARERLAQAAKDPKGDLAMANLALFLLRERKVDAALAWARRAVSVNPRTPQRQRVLGEVSLAAGRFAEAERAYRRALIGEPHVGRTHLGLGAALVAQGRAPEADPHLAEAVRINPRLAPDVALIRARGAVRPRLTP